MAPLPAPEPFELLDTVEVVDARKLRFERNRIKLPMGVEATFGMIRHPHRQFDPVALETELASIQHLNGFQQLEGFR